jgi:nucleoid DNA-binding protein
MGRLTINSLAKLLMQKHGLDKNEALQFLTAVFETVQYGLQKDKQVKVKGLGTFKVIEVEARESINVNTGERLLIESHSKITFVPDTAMKDLVNKPFSSFETVILNDGVIFDDMETASQVIKKEIETLIEQPDGDDETMEEQVMEPEVGVEYESETNTDEMTPLLEMVDVQDSQEEGTVESSSEESPIEEPPTKESPTEESPIEEPPIEESPIEEPPTEEIPTEEIPTEEPPTEEENDYGMNAKPKERKWLWPVLFVLGCAASFFLGYQSSRYFEPKPYFQNIDTILVEDTILIAGDSVAVADSLKADDMTLDSLTTNSMEASSATEEVSEPEVDYRKYEEMDARVRTGAYRIVGTERVVKSTPGETLGYISGRMLGPDMVCYVEVYNGLKSSNKALEAGTEIKIPKLELKKKKKKNKDNNNQ